MNESVTGTHNALISELQRRLTYFPDAVEAKKLIHTIADAGAIYFEDQPMHELHDTFNSKSGFEYGLPAEQLLRFISHDTINKEAALEEIEKHRLHDMFDMLVSLNVVNQAIQKNRFPISNNISSRNIENPAFWGDWHGLLQNHYENMYKPGCLTIELLEVKQREYFPILLGNKSYESKVDRLMAFKEATGYKFALDDVTHEQHDIARLMLHGRLADEIKIDGNTILNATEDQIEELVENSARYAPNAITVAEWVQGPEHAKYLQERFGIKGAQGMCLSHDRGEFQNNFKTAKPVAPRPMVLA